METSMQEFLSGIKADLRDWVAARFEWIRLELMEKISIAGSNLIFGLVAINLVFFALLFAFVALAFLFAEWVGNTAIGFAMVTGIYLLLLALMIIFRRSILNGLGNWFLKELYPELKEKKDE